jgi:hypothetical protein
MDMEKYRHTRQERAELLRRIKNVWSANNELELMRILRENGVNDEDPRFAEIVRLFRDMRSGKTSKPNP